MTSAAKKILRFLGVLIIIFISSFLLFSYTKKEAPPLNAHKDKGDNYKNTTDDFSEELKRVVMLDGPTAAFKLLKQTMETDKAVFNGCHALVHQIGHAAYHQMGLEKAMEKSDDICGSGYMHGIVEEHFASLSDIPKAIKTACASVRPEAKASCHHGIGHGLMYALDNNILASLAYCDQLQKEKMNLRCAEGVFMEHFSTDMDHHTNKDLKKENPSYPCENMTETYKPVCYFYAPIHALALNNFSYEKTLLWCTSLPEHAYTCAYGTGSRVMKAHIDSIAETESICETVPEYSSHCIAGMTSYYFVHTNSVEETQKMCEKLNTKNQKTCQETLQARIFRF